MRSCAESLHIWRSSAALWCRKRLVERGTAAGSVRQRVVRRLETQALKYSDLDIDCRRRLDTYLRYLLAENEKYNLTGFKSFEDCIEQLVHDSAALIPIIESNRRHGEPSPRVIDIGSGAGIPGIIFAILKQDWQVVCLEASQKKTNFVSQAIQQCNLTNAEVVRGRAEEVARDMDYREGFDIAVSRGVGELRVVSEYSLPFVKQGGVFVSPKGPSVQEEVETAKAAWLLLGGHLRIVSPVDSFGSQGQRTVVVVEKIRPTPPNYPRRAGIPSKRPL